jgi:hypothetical protein
MFIDKIRLFTTQLANSDGESTQDVTNKNKSSHMSGHEKKKTAKQAKKERKKQQELKSSKRH